MMYLLIVLAVLFFGLYALVQYLERTSVFYPSKTMDSTPAHIGLAFEDLYLSAQDGIKINAWLVKANDPKAATIIFAHGNAGTMSHRVMRLKFWHDLGLNTLIFDYRGYGKSQGKPTENGVYLDAQAAYDYLISRPDINHDRIISYGASLGGVVAVNLATKRKVAAVIVEATITSAKEMGQRLYPFLPAFMMSIKLDSISKVPTITAPKLFMHSPEDHTVPISMGKRLFEAASEPKEFLQIHGGHNDGSLMTDIDVQAGFKKFLKEYSLL